MTTPVTGAFGCIGAWVIRAGERPVVFDLGDDPWRVAHDRGDIADRLSLERVGRDYGIRRVIHLAAWHVPLCRRDPPRGASINVTGTEAAASTSGS
jgi:UDP-glucuronate 4-epimerase